MRLIGTIDLEKDAKRFSIYLAHKGIENLLEKGSSASAFQVWVADEDRLQEASDELARFVQNPSDPMYQKEAPLAEEAPPAPPEEKGDPVQRKRMTSPMTLFLLAACIFVFFLNHLQEMQISSEKREELPIVMTPVQKALFYDVPPVFLEEKGIETGSYWQGIYDLIILKLKHESLDLGEGSLFTQIRRGEIWRIVSPCILHINFFHILFNMIWLWMLGRPIEARIGSFRLLLLTLVGGSITNTAQYLMSGPLFLGFSGVITTWAGLIWMREKIAPWEVYPLHRTTILFLAIFIFAMLGLQILSFFLQVMTSIPFVLNIANTAHIAGFILGAVLGRLSCFAWRVR